jgi:hypothetical protein
MRGKDSCLLVPSLHCHVVQMQIMFIKRVVSVTRDLRPWPSHHKSPAQTQTMLRLGSRTVYLAVETSDSPRCCYLRMRVMVQDCKHGTNGEYGFPSSIEYSFTNCIVQIHTCRGAQAVVDIQRLTNQMHNKLQGLKCPLHRAAARAHHHISRAGAI